MQRDLSLELQSFIGEPDIVGFDASTLEVLGQYPFLVSELTLAVPTYL